MIYTSTQLNLIFSSIRPENVDITPSSDMSSIDSIRSNWRWPIPCPSDSELDSIWNGIKKEYLLQECYKNRNKEYPPITDLADALAKINGDDPNRVEEGKIQLQNYSDACIAVKNKYPKPS